MSTTLIASTEEDCIKNELRNLWELETIGIGNEVPIEEKVRDDIRFDQEEGKYEVGQPWNDKHKLMGDNFRLAKSRTVSVIRKLQKSDPELLGEYNDIIGDQLKNRVLERVDENMKGEIGKTYNMPQQLVVRKDRETTKIRGVFDCSSKMGDSPSLNECLDVPDANYTDLFAVMVTFRMHKVGLVADIEKAFLMIRMRKEDRDSHRLIWVKNPFAGNLEFEVLRFTTVTFGAGPSMWQLGSVIKHHLGKFEDSYPATVERIDEALYADDFSSGGKDDEDTCQLYSESRQIFKEAGMNLRKWKSNSDAVTEFIKLDEGVVEEQQNESSDSESYASMMLNPADQSPTKVLGSPWNLKSDMFELSLQKVVERKVTTKLELLSVSNSIFDVLGLLAPVVFFIKCLFQEVCKEKGTWNDELSEEVKKKWKKWVAGAEKFTVFEVPRWYGAELTSDNMKIMFVGFSDASKKGFAAVLYIRLEDPVTGKVVSNLVSSKTRVAPIVEQTIPRLELLGGMILAKLMRRCRDILQKNTRIEREYCLTDSAVALHWVVNNDRTYKQYVENRVKKIRNNSTLKGWRHVAGTDNIADLPSRGCTPDQLDKRKDEWFHGPKWLLGEESTWPVRKAEELVMTEQQKSLVDKEEKKKEAKVKEKVVLLSKAEEVDLDEIIDPTRYSTLTKLLRITALCLKFIDRLKKKKVEVDISAEDIGKAKDMWIRQLQSRMKKECKYQKTAESLGVKEDSLPPK